MQYFLKSYNKLKALLLVLLLLLLFINPNNNAQWIQTDGPEGGFFVKFYQLTMNYLFLVILIYLFQKTTDFHGAGDQHCLWNSVTYL